MSVAEKTTHYDEKYFQWQSSIGAFGAWANRTKFESEIRPTDDVIDFGCGGGFLLAGLTCRRKIGIEVNPTARANAIAHGIEALPSISDVSDGSADVIISNHALEHCERPLDELRALRAKMKPGGKAVFIVPCETILQGYHLNDINQHLYTWSPLNLGNLFTRAGYAVENCGPYIHTWPPSYEKIARLGGRAIFDLCCRIYARLERRHYQVRIVARRPRE
jgi:SAM-dependent methyltransferase